MIKITTVDRFPAVVRKINGEDRFLITINSKNNKHVLNADQYMRVEFGSVVKWYISKDYNFTQVSRLEAWALEDIREQLIKSELW